MISLRKTAAQYLVPGVAVLTLSFLPTQVFAGLVYEPLVGIPGVDNAATNFTTYINQLYFLSISIAALLAVIKIIIGGVKWMLTDVVPQKSEARNDIKGAIFGLLLIISAFLILNTINPQLTNLTALQTLQPLNTTSREEILRPQGPNNGTNPNWVASQRERCQNQGGTWEDPTRLFTNGNCRIPRNPVRPASTPTNPSQPTNSPPPTNEPPPDMTPPGA
jgi:hypothetical protein